MVLLSFSEDLAQFPPNPNPNPNPKTWVVVETYNEKYGADLNSLRRFSAVDCEPKADILGVNWPRADVVTWFETPQGLVVCNQPHPLPV